MAIRNGNEWFVQSKTFIGELIYETEEGSIQAYGHDEDEILQKTDCVKYEQYGFCSRIREGVEICCIPMESDEIAIIGTFHNERPTLTAGQSCMWDDQDNQILLKADDGGIDIDAQNGDVQVKADDYILLGDGATDFVALATLVKTELQAIITWANAHKHIETGSETNPPTILCDDADDVKCTKVKAK